MNITIIPKYPCTLETLKAAKLVEQLLSYSYRLHYEKLLQELLTGSKPTTWP